MSDLVACARERFERYKAIWFGLHYNLRIFVYCLLASIFVMLFTGFLWQAVVLCIILYLAFRKKEKKGGKHG